MQKFSNAARSNLALAINASVTSLAVTAGTGSKFPALGADDWFWATLQEGDNLEIVKVTARSTDTLTVERPTDGTAKSFTTAAVIGLRPVAADFDKAIGFQTAYNVLAYGADPKGVSDSSTAIQEAIDAAYADGGGLVEIPAGIYLLNASVRTYPSVALKGAGRRATILRGNLNGMSVLYAVYPSDGRIGGVVIRDLTLTSGGRTTVTGIKIYGNNKDARLLNVFLDDLELLGDLNSDVPPVLVEMAIGIDLSFCANVKLNSIFMSSVTTGTKTSMCADVDMVSVTVQNGGGPGIRIIGDDARGEEFTYDEGYRLVSCNTNGQQKGLEISGHDWGTASSCSFTTAPGGPLIMSSCTNWHFSSCEFAGSSSQPGGNVASPAYIGTESAHVGVQFIGCTFSSATYGLILNGEKHVVSGCVFNANSANDLFLGASATTRYCTITGNVFVTSHGLPRIREGELGVTADYNTITGNVLKLGGGSGLVRAAGSGANSLYEIPTTPATPLNVFY